MPRFHAENGSFRPMTEDEISSFFDESYTPEPMSGCWLWTETTQKSGYGELCKRAMHRYSYERFIGEIPKGMHVLHRCDVPSCVNPNHLFIGTQRDNNDDKMEKGRASGGSLKGEIHPMVKLTEKAVRQIVCEYENGARNQSALGRKYGVSQGTIWQIVNKKTWPHLWNTKVAA